MTSGEHPQPAGHVNVIHGPDHRRVARVNCPCLGEGDALQGGILAPAPRQVVGPELVVVADQPGHWMSHNHDQLRVVLDSPHPSSNAQGVEVARCLLVRHLPLGDVGHLPDVPVQAPGVVLVVVVNLILGSLDLTVHIEKLQQRPCAPLICAEYHRRWQRLVLRRPTQVCTKLLHVLCVLESVSRVIFFIMILITYGGDVIVIKIVFMIIFTLLNDITMIIFVFHYSLVALMADSAQNKQ